MQISDFAEFLAASPSAFHAATNVRDELVAAGFTEDTGTEPGGHVLVQGGAVVAWWIPENPRPAMRIIGSHTDSPGLMLKPDPDVVREGFRQLAVEVYGGPILSSWFDRELRFAGRVAEIGPIVDPHGTALWPTKVCTGTSAARHARTQAASVAASEA